MKHFLILLFLLLSSFFLSSSSYSEWKKVSNTHRNGDVYLDPNKIKFKENHVYFYILFDHLIPFDVGFDRKIVSTIHYMQARCTTNSYRYLSSSYFLNPMGNGKPYRFDDRTGEWRNITTNILGKNSLALCNYFSK